MDVGVIGTGAMGYHHVRVYSELKEVDDLYVYDTNHDLARTVGHRVGAVIVDTLDALLKSVDSVSVCVPTPGHGTIGREVLSAGVHMLIEKPFCSTAKEAMSLINCIEDGTVVGVGHVERFNPIVPEIKRICKKPLYVEMNRHNPASGRVGWSSVVEDLMIHDVDILKNVLFKECDDQTYNLTSSGTDDIVCALFSFGSTPAILSASRKSSKKVRKIYIEEEEFTLEADFMSQEVYVYRKPDNYRIENERYLQENVIEKLLVNKLEPLKVELKTFLECVRHGREFPVSPRQGIENLRICEEIRQKCA
jgi:predicted dehydrogenase